MDQLFFRTFVLIIQELSVALHEQLELLFFMEQCFPILPALLRNPPPIGLPVPNVCLMAVRSFCRKVGVMLHI